MFLFGSSQECRDTNVVQGQQAELEVMVVCEPQAPRFIIFFLSKKNGKS